MAVKKRPQELTSSIYITRDEIETMMNVLQERMIARQEEMMKNFF